MKLGIKYVYYYMPSAGVMRGSAFLEKVTWRETGISATLSMSRQTSTPPADSATVLFAPTI